MLVVFALHNGIAIPHFNQMSPSVSALKPLPDYFKRGLSACILLPVYKLLLLDIRCHSVAAWQLFQNVLQDRQLFIGSSDFTINGSSSSSSSSSSSRGGGGSGGGSSGSCSSNNNREKFLIFVLLPLLLLLPPPLPFRVVHCVSKRAHL